MKKSVIASIILGVFLIITGIVLYQHKDTVQTKVLVATKNIESAKATIIPEPTQILSSGLPDYHLIKTVFIPQAPEKIWTQPWQDACEEASILTLYYYYRNQTLAIADIKAKIIDMIAYEDKQGWGLSINIDQMAQIATDYLGYTAEVISNPTIEDIKGYVAQDIPVVVPAAGKMLYQENKFFNSGGPIYHALVIVGYDDNKRKFIVDDVGTQYGANFKYSYNLLMDSIHDWPETEDENDILLGAKKVLIIRNTVGQ